MKREILCLLCGQPRGVRNDKLVNAIDAALAQQEHTIRHRGISRGSYTCDQCGRAMEEGEDVICLSTMAINQSYFPWETDYIR